MYTLLAHYSQHPGPLLTALMYERIKNTVRAWSLGSFGHHEAKRRCRPGRTWPRLQQRGGAPGGAAPPIARGCARRIATARGGPSQGSPGCGSQRTRRLPALHFPCAQGRGKMGKGDARRPKIQVPGGVALACLTSEYEAIVARMSEATCGALSARRDCPRMSLRSSGLQVHADFASAAPSPPPRGGRRAAYRSPPCRPRTCADRAPRRRARPPPSPTRSLAARPPAPARSAARADRRGRRRRQSGS